MSIERHQHIRVAIVVEVSNAESLRPAFRLQSSLGRDVAKTPCTIVSVQNQSHRLEGFVLFEGPSVREQQIAPAITVEVEDGDTVTCGFQNVVFPAAAAICIGVNQSRLAGDVRINDAGGRLV